MRIATSIFTWVILGLGLQAQDNFLPDARRTNGKETLSALSLLQGTTKLSLAQVVNDVGDTVLQAMVITEDGYLLTKASELPQRERVSLSWSDHSLSSAQVIIIDRTLDVALLKVDRKDTVPITWEKSAPSEAGEWLCAYTRNSPTALANLRLGVVSANRRSIAGRGAAMGIRMNDRDGAVGIRVVEVATESPAEQAGIKVGDSVMAVEDQAVEDTQSIAAIIQNAQPGQNLKLRIRRAQTERDCLLRLASRTKVEANWDGEDYANGGVSLRTDTFPEVLQHQIPLFPQDMGGPLINLDGKVIGMNIARVDRVTTFALPLELFWSKVQQWIVQDRQG
jgi:serine protease Do